MVSSKLQTEHKNAVIYIRVSTSEQAENNLSLDSQLDSCKEYADRLGYNVLEVFREEGQSAKTANRDEFLRAIEFCRTNKDKVEVFVVWKLDRFSRNSADHHAVKGMLVSLGVKLESVTEPIDDSATGQLMESILAGFAEFDNKLRAERSRVGMVRRSEQGSWQHGSPTGYDCVRDAQGRPTLKPNSNSELIKKILLAFNSGTYSQRGLMDMAEDIGLTNKKGKPFGKQTISNWLRNPVYAGLIKTSMTEESVPGLHEPLITLEQFQENQNILAGKKKYFSASNTKEDFPLKTNGFLKCAVCSNSLTASNTRGNGGLYPRYSCTTCKSAVLKKPVSVGKERIHEEFYELLDSITPSESVLRLFETVLLKQWDLHYQETRSLRRELDRKLIELEDFRSKTTNKFITGDITKEEKESINANTDSEIITAQLKRSEYQEQEVDSKTLVTYATTFIKNAKKLWQDAPFEQKVWFQKLVFPEGLEYEFGKGFRTANLGVCYRVINDFATDKSTLVGPPGLEPGTNRL